MLNTPCASVHICTDTDRYSRICQTLTIQKDQYSELPTISKTNPANNVPKILQQQLFINTSTNHESRDMSNFIRQNQVYMANESLKVQLPYQAVLESLNEMDEKPCITNTEHCTVTQITVMGPSFPAPEC